MGVRSIVLLAGLILLTPIPTAAQSGGVIVRVRGPMGPLAGADVEVVYPGILLVRGETDANGTARILPIPPGTYNVTVQLLGYVPGRQERVRVEAGFPSTLEFNLAVAPVELEGITVRADRIEIQRETVEYATELEEEALDLLPVSRETRELVALTPGARADHVWGGLAPRPTATAWTAFPPPTRGRVPTSSNPARSGSPVSASVVSAPGRSTGAFRGGWWT